MSGALGPEKLNFETRQVIKMSATSPRPFVLGRVLLFGPQSAAGAVLPYDLRTYFSRMQVSHNCRTCGFLGAEIWNRQKRSSLPRRFPDVPLGTSRFAEEETK